MSDFRLRVFSSVAKNLSFTKASQELFISQPAITKHIQELETMYQTRLFERMGNKILLTDAGRLFLEHFEKILEDFSQNTGKKLKVIEDFCNWLDVSDVNRHSNERKSILSSVLFDIQAGSEPLGICEVIENVERLYTSAKGQFDNYLEDFKYEKFVQKLEENSEKFIGRVNDSISKVLSQILALPIAAAAPVILKGQGKSSEIVIYLALLVYATICYFALSTQKAVLDHLESEVNNFGKEGMLPKSLGEKWNIEKKKILLLIDKQTHLYWIMRGIICIVIAYSAFKIFDTSF